jgi:hypothetical protein
VPRYFFSFRDGGELHDNLGMALADEPTARDEAIRGARSIIADCARRGRLPLSARVQVEDESGRLVFALTFKDTVKIE